MQVLIAVSVGELLDKISILEIKAVKIREPDARANVLGQLSSLRDSWRTVVIPDEPMLQIIQLATRLRAVNLTLWDAEETIHAVDERFELFNECARSIIKANGERYAIKRAIDTLCNSPVEEKSYA